MGGDFNDLLNTNEKRGGTPISRRKCDIFKQRIKQQKLMDLGFTGHKFTLRGPIYHGSERIYERLDKALCNDHWRIQFPESLVKVLTRLEFSQFLLPPSLEES